jgi:hypothetical protein
MAAIFFELAANVSAAVTTSPEVPLTLLEEIIDGHHLLRIALHELTTT